MYSLGLVRLIKFDKMENAFCDLLSTHAHTHTHTVHSTHIDDGDDSTLLDKGSIRHLVSGRGDLGLSSARGSSFNQSERRRPE